MKTALLRNSIRLLVLVVAHAPIVFLRNTVKWDNLDVVLPYRYLLGKMWGSGILPLWNPYQQMGYPMFADLQSPTWYPETILIGLLGGYTNYTIHFLLIAYAFIGSIGFSKLVEWYGVEKRWSLVAGLVYVLSGFWIGHAQALFVWVSAAWIPFMWLYFLRTLKEPSVRNGALLVAFSYLQLTGGYATLTIMFIYLVLVLLLERGWKDRAIQGLNVARIKVLGCALLILAIMGLPLLIGVYESQEYVARLGGLSGRKLFDNPFSLPCFLSFVFPMSTLTDEELFATNLSMRNAFVGTISLLFFLMGFKRLIKPGNLVLSLFSLVCVLAALGDLLPVRSFLADALPGMDLFRIPAYFMYFPIMVIIIFGFKELQDVDWTKERTIVLLGALLPLLLVLALSFLRIENSGIEGLGFYQMLFYGSVYTILVYLFIYWNRSRLMKLLPVFIVLELVVHSLIMGPYTAYNPRKATTVRTYFDQMPSDFHTSIQDTIYKTNDQTFRMMPGLWRNTGIYQLQPSYDGFSSFWFTAVNDTLESGSAELMESQWIESRARIEIELFKPSMIEFRSESLEAETVTIHQAWFPGWKAYIDGEQTEVIKSGVFQKVEIPKGNHFISMRFERPWIKRLWLLGLGLWISVLLISIKHKKSET